MLKLPSLDAVPFFSSDVGGQRVDTFVMVYDQSGLKEGPLRFKQILARIRKEIRHYPRFQHLYRPSLLPLGERQWAIDEAFDAEFHVRHIALPKPGDWRQFCIQVARLHSRPLDQTRPLWEINVVEGLDDVPWPGQGHFALVCKIHHALLDPGQKQDLVWTLHDEVDSVADEFSAAGRSMLSPLFGLLRDGSDNLLRPLSGPLNQAGGYARQRWSELLPVIRFYAGALVGRRRVPYTRFNTDVSSYRVWEGCSFPKEELAALLARYPGVSEDDLMVALIAGALRRYLSGESELNSRALWALAPAYDVSGEPDPDMQALAVVDLASNIADPVERLRSISRWRRDQAEPFVSASVAQGPLLSPLRRMALSNDLLHRIQGQEAGRGPVANTALITLPGEEQSLSLLGAPLIYFSGVPEIANGMGLVHLAGSHGEWLNLTVTSCREMLPDPAHYRGCIYQSLQELLDADPADKKELSL